jgi:molecular chaperone GrpE
MDEREATEMVTDSGPDGSSSEGIAPNSILGGRLRGASSERRTQAAPEAVEGGAAEQAAEQEAGEALAQDEGEAEVVQEAEAAVEEAEAVVLQDLAKLAAERDDYLDQLRRTKADFNNYRKRMLRQQTEHLERAAEELVEKLLPVLDNFDAALTHGEGFEQVHSTLMAALEKEGLERIHPEGKPFDPTEADAVAHDEGDDGPVVAEVLRPGYRWKGRVVRPAMVRVRG